MSESSTGRVCIDEPPEAVESMLQFMYTGEIRQRPVREYADLLKVADRYQVTELFNEVLPRLATDLTPASLVPALRALRPFVEQVQVAKVWKHLLRAARDNDEMIEALAFAL